MFENNATMNTVFRVEFNIMWYAVTFFLKLKTCSITIWSWRPMLIENTFPAVIRGFSMGVVKAYSISPHSRAPLNTRKLHYVMQVLYRYTIWSLNCRRNVQTFNRSRSLVEIQNYFLPSINHKNNLSKTYF